MLVPKQSLYIFSVFAIILLIFLIAGCGNGGEDETTYNPSSPVQPFYFAASDGTHGHELWVSDGTEVGTTMIKDINPDPYGVFPPSGFTSVNGIVYFAADDGTHGVELWRTDGTPSGTQIVKDIHPDADNGSYPINLINFNDNLYFFGLYTINSGYGLWKSDGTEQGTTLLYDQFDIPNTPDCISNFVILNGSLFFGIETLNQNFELWQIDDETNTPLIVNSSAPIGASVISSLRVIKSGELLFFVGLDQNGDLQLWKSDGTDAGTTIAKNFSPTGWFNIEHLTDVNGALFFIVADNGYQLWKTDGTEQGTVQVYAFTNFVVPMDGDDASFILTNVNGTVFFTTHYSTPDYMGSNLWKTDGTEQGTVIVKDLGQEGITASSAMMSVNGLLYFSAFSQTMTSVLCVSDGTAAGTISIDISPHYMKQVSGFQNVSGTLFFQGDDGISGLELWRSGGKETSTFMVKDINVGPGGCFWPS